MPVPVRDGRLGLTPEGDRAHDLLCHRIDRGPVVGAVVEGDDPLARRIIEDRVGDRDTCQKPGTVKVVLTDPIAQSQRTIANGMQGTTVNGRLSVRDRFVGNQSIDDARLLSDSVRQRTFEQSVEM